MIIKFFQLFYVDLNPNENNKAVFDIREIADCKITIKPPENPRGIHQCIKCQQVENTKKNL